MQIGRAFLKIFYYYFFSPLAQLHIQLLGLGDACSSGVVTGWFTLLQCIACMKTFIASKLTNTFPFKQLWHMAPVDRNIFFPYLLVMLQESLS